jgi:cell division protein FtsB
VIDGDVTMPAIERDSATSPQPRPPEPAESVWSLAAFWLVAFAGSALFAAVMIAPRWEQKQQIAARVHAMSAQCGTLRDTNDHLHRVIDAFKHDPDFTEEMARSELGYVAPGEQRIAAPVRNGTRPQEPEAAPPPDLWAPFVRLFAHDRLVRQTALVTAAVFLVVALAFFHPQPEPSSPDRSST